MKLKYLCHYSISVLFFSMCLKIYFFNFFPGIQLPEDVIIADEDDSDDGDEYVIEDQFQRPKEAEEENYQDSLWYYDPLIEGNTNSLLLYILKAKTEIVIKN